MNMLEGYQGNQSLKCAPKHDEQVTSACTQLYFEGEPLPFLVWVTLFHILLILQLVLLQHVQTSMKNYREKSASN